MMRLKKTNMKFINKTSGVFASFFMLMTFGVSAQLAQDSLVLMPVTKVDPNKRVDGVIAVVGDHIILDSDIDKTYLEIQAGGMNVENFTRCEIMGKLMEDKFYAHHAVQDSVLVSDAEIYGIVENNIGYLMTNIGPMNKILEYYRVKTEDDFRAQLYEVAKINKLTQGMQDK